MVFNIASQFVLLFVSVSQSSLTTIRTGDVSRQLTEQDVVALERVLPSGAKPWLLDGDPAQIASFEFIQAYLSPTTATSTLRRGPVISVMRRFHHLLNGLCKGLARTRKWQFPDEISIRLRGMRTSIGHFKSSVILMIRNSSASSVFSGRIRPPSEEKLTRYDCGQSFS